MPWRFVLWCIALLLAAPGTASASGIFRTAAYEGGEWVATNGIGQARGANTDGLHRGEYFGAIGVPGDPTNDSRDLSRALNYGFFGAYRASHNGDYELPRDPASWPDGTGDLAEVRMTLDGRFLVVTFVWNSMPRPDAQIATLAFGGPGAAERPWPRGARLTSAWARAVTVWGTGASVTAADGSEHKVDAAAGDHLTSARVPLSDLPDGPWTITAGSGLGDPAAPGSYWAVPSGDAAAGHPGSGGPTSPTNVWDLVLVRDQPWSFDERRQADLLATGTATGVSFTVDPALLASKAVRGPGAVTGDLSRMFVSRLAGPDGIEKGPGLIRPQAPESVVMPSRESGFDQAWNYT